MRRLTGLLFALLCLLQGSQALALIVPDQCALLEAHREGRGGDECPSGCARCVCGGQRPLVLPSAIPTVAASTLFTPSYRALAAGLRSGLPRDILHVPKPQDIR